jgi:hypothetical protein
VRSYETLAQVIELGNGGELGGIGVKPALGEVA